jgi:hypothetical protein
MIDISRDGAVDIYTTYELTPIPTLQTFQRIRLRRKALAPYSRAAIQIRQFSKNYKRTNGLEDTNNYSSIKNEKNSFGAPCA